MTITLELPFIQIWLRLSLRAVYQLCIVTDLFASNWSWRGKKAPLFWHEENVDILICFHTQLNVLNYVWILGIIAYKRWYWIILLASMLNTWDCHSGVLKVGVQQYKQEVVASWSLQLQCPWEAYDIPRLMTENVVWGNVLFQKSSELGSQDKYAKVCALDLFLLTSPGPLPYWHKSFYYGRIWN